MGFGRGGGSFGGDAFARSPLQDVWGVQRLSAETVAGLAAITSGASLASVMGCSAPDGLWKGDEASSPATDLVGSVDLADQGAPTRSTADATFGVDGVTLAVSSTDEHRASSTASLDLGSESFAAVLIASGYGTTSGAVALVGKAAAGSGAGWFLRNDGSPYQGLRLIARDGTTTKTETIALDHTAGSGVLCLLLVSDRNANNVQIWSGLGSSSGQATNSNSHSNSAYFSIGRQATASINAAAMNWCMAAFWKGANAEGLTSTHRQALADYLGVA